MADFFSYLSWLKVLVLVVALMSGLLSLVREWMLIHRPERVNEKGLFWGCIRTAFILSAVAIWGMEHATVIDLNHQMVKAKEQFDGLTKPKLSGEVLSSFSGTLSDKARPSTKVTVVAKIKNFGAPSIIDNWHLKLTLPDGTTYNPIPTMVTSDRMVYRFAQNPDPIVLYNDDSFIPNANRLIPQNGQVTGWIMFEVPGMSNMDFPLGSKLDLSFDDSLGATYHIFQTLTPGAATSPNAWSGMRLPTQKVKP